jgi:hypothetical protein
MIRSTLLCCVALLAVSGRLAAQPCTPAVTERTQLSRSSAWDFYDQGRASIAAIHPGHRLLAERRLGRIGRVEYSLLVYQPPRADSVLLEALAVDYETQRGWDVRAKCTPFNWPEGLIRLLETLAALPQPARGARLDERCQACAPTLTVYSRRAHPSPAQAPPRK